MDKNRPFLIDVSRLIGRVILRRLPTGIDRVSLEYLRHFGGRARAVLRFWNTSFILSSALSDQIFSLLLSPIRYSRQRMFGLVINGLLTSWKESKTPSIFFNTGHTGLERSDYPKMLRRLKTKPVFMIHDLIPITFPEYCGPSAFNKHQTRIKHALNEAAGIITISQSTLNELSSFAKNQSIAMPPTVTALLAPGLIDGTFSKRPVDKPYFVVLGTIEPRKNHLLLLQIWRRLAEQKSGGVPHLVIIGQRGWEYENIEDMLERCQALKGHVTELSACSDKQLIAYLKHAQALLFPTFVEGFGMPIVEALAHGVPVIASDLAVFREMAGDIPVYIDPLDGSKWIQCINEYSRFDSPQRQAQLNKIKDFNVPTWAQHFAKVDRFLENLGN